MITFDGDRSIKRKWFANKQIEAIKAIGVPSKALKWDGFTFTAWQQGDLSGGRVTAPMGAVVLCSSPEGIKGAVSEYWLGGFGILNDYYRIRNFINLGTFVYATSKGLLDETQWLTEKFEPSLRSGHYSISGSSFVTVTNYSCAPSVTPYKTAEGFQVTVSDIIEYSGTTTLFFSDDIFAYGTLGSSLNRIIFFRSFLGGYTNQRYYPCLVSQNHPNGVSTSFLNPVSGNYWAEIDGDAPGGAATVAATKVSSTVDEELGLTLTTESVYLRDMYPVGSIPELVRASLLTEVFVAFHLGSYAFTAVDGTYIILRASYFDSGNLVNFFKDDYNEKWHICLSITIGDQVYVHNWDQFFDLLQDRALGSLKNREPMTRATELAQNPSEIQQAYKAQGIRRMVQYFFPWPNATVIDSDTIYFPTVPYDSAMFHGHDDKVYTWTRATGSVVLDSTGMNDATIVVPAEVTNTEGVRPEISFAGEELYFCSCNKVKESVVATYYGSPFSSWTKLPGPEEGTLVQVRPVMVTIGRIFLIGVLKTQVDIEGVLTDKYRFVSFAQTTETVGVWRVLGVLPFEVGESDNFAMALYGNDALVQSMYRYPSPPPAVPQSHVGPYENYAEWRP